MSSDLAPELTPAVVGASQEDEAAPGRRPAGHGPAVTVGTGLGVAALTYAVVDLAGGPVGVLVLLALLVVVPTASALPNRLAVNIALFLGWTPLLWWVDWPVPVNHGAAALAAAAGVTAAVTVRRTGFAAPRWLLPTVRAADLLLPLATLVSALAVRPWLFVRSPQGALAALVPGADNWAHFSMFMSMRISGAAPVASGPGPDGSPWAYADYPRGFHAVVATLSEMTDPGLTAGPHAVVVYARVVGLVVLLGALLVTATALSFPSLRARPWTALPVLAVSLTALLWEPGQKVVANGFASFWLAAVAVAVALLLAFRESRPGLSVVAAVTGLVVLVSHSWMPLVVLVLPAIGLVLRAHLGRGRWRARESGWVLVVVGLGGLAGLQALWTLMTSVPVGFVVSEVSGFDMSSPIPTLVLLVVGIAVLACPTSLLAARAREAHEDDLHVRMRWLLAMPLLGLATLTTLLVAQLHAIGTTSYYFLKLLLGFELVLAVVVPVVVGLVVVLFLPQALRGVQWKVLSVCAALLATQAFGVLAPSGALLFSTTDDGTAAISAPYDRADMARGILAAVRATDPSSSLTQEYVALGPGNALQIFYPDAWFHAISGSATSAAFERMAVLRHRADTPARLAPLVTRLARDDGALEFLTPGEQRADALRGELSPHDAQRVRTLHVPGGPAS